MNWIRSLTDGQSRQAKVFDRVIYALILWSMLSFSLETLPAAVRYHRIFAWSELIVVAVFSLEWALRLAVFRRRYAWSFYGVVDLLSVLPFYLSLGAIDARAIRVLRLLRLLRLAKLQRYGTAWRRISGAFAEVRDELVVYGVLTVLVLFVASVGIYYCEHDAQPETFSSVFHSMWWAVATLSTVGYGDAYPVTILGRVFTGVVLILGLGVVAVPSGLLASALVRQAHNDRTKGG